METRLTRLLNEKLLEKFDGNASELARAVGTSQQNISNWLNGDVIKPAYWKKAARALGMMEVELYDVMTLTRDEAGVDIPPGAWESQILPRISHPHKRDVNLPASIIAASAAAFSNAPPPNATIAPRQPVVTTNKMLPVLGMAVGGEDGRYIFNGSVIDYVVCPPSLENVAGAYAVYIDGESMYPRFKAGETVWVHPGKPARRGDDVIVQLKPIEDDGSPPWGYVKEYVGRQGNNLVLRQYNPPIEIQFDVNDVLTTHPIVLAGKY